MKTIKELLKRYYLPELFQPMGSDMLRRDLESASLDPVIRFINYIIRENGNSYHPDRIIYILEKLNIHNEEGLIEFYNFFISHGAEYILSTIDKKIGIDLNEFELIGIQQLHDFIFNKTNIYPSMSDTEYYVLTDKHIQVLIDSIRFESLPYKVDGRDCDDFSKMFRAKLSTAGIGNLSVGTIIAEEIPEDQNEDAMVHSFIVFATADNLIYYDPKTKFKGSIYEIMLQYKLIKTAKIRSIEF